MSAIRIMPTGEADQGFGLLKDIVEMVKNPKAIDEAYEARSKAAKLSDDEIAKANEARDLIAQADSIRAELKEREDVLNLALSEHENKVSIDIERVKGENSQLDARENRLNQIAAQQELDFQKNKEANDLLDKRTVKIESDSSQLLEQYDEKIAILAETEEAQEEEDARLKNWAEKLRAKAARLAAEAQSDG